MVLEACRKVENNQCQVEIKKQDKKPTSTIVGPGWVPDDNYGFGSKYVELSSLQKGSGTIKVGAFDDKGKAMFTDPEYKDLNKKALNNLRLQYSLSHEGHDIGRGGIGGWGGDSIIGKKSNQAIFAIMKKEHLNYNQAVAWSMDTTYKKIGLGEAGPFYNPATGDFDRKTPIWGSKPKNASLAYEAHTYSQYEDQRKHGAKREHVEDIWSQEIEPTLKKNGHSDKYINSVHQDFKTAGNKYVCATDQKSTLKGEKKIEETKNSILSKEARFAYIKRQWDNDLYPALKKHHIAHDAIIAIGNDFFGEKAYQIYEAKNVDQMKQAMANFEDHKKYMMSWVPNEKGAAA